MGLPIWARWVRVSGAAKDLPGTIDVPVDVGGATIRPGDIVVLDADGVAVVEPERVEEVLAAAARPRGAGARQAGALWPGGAVVRHRRPARRRRGAEPYDESRSTTSRISAPSSC